MERGWYWYRREDYPDPTHILQRYGDWVILYFDGKQFEVGLERASPDEMHGTLLGPIDPPKDLEEDRQAESTRRSGS